MKYDAESFLRDNTARVPMRKSSRMSDWAITRKNNVQPWWSDGEREGRYLAGKFCNYGRIRSCGVERIWCSKNLVETLLETRQGSRFCISKLPWAIIFYCRFLSTLFSCCVESSFKFTVRRCRARQSSNQRTRKGVLLFPFLAGRKRMVRRPFLGPRWCRVLIKVKIKKFH